MRDSGIGCEIDRHRVARLRVADALVDEVLLVLRLALDVALGGQEFFAALPDLEVNVRGPAGVRHRLDGAEVVFAGGPGQEPAETLEVLVVFGAMGILGVDVGPVVVDLPDLDEGITHGSPLESRIRPVR